MNNILHLNITNINRKYEQMVSIFLIYCMGIEKGMVDLYRCERLNKNYVCS